MLLTFYTFIIVLCVLFKSQIEIRISYVNVIVQLYNDCEWSVVNS